MMKMLKAIAPLLIFILAAGCGRAGTIYNIAADERDVSAMVTDKKITTLIQKAFLEDRDAKIIDISVYCYNGDVYLVGECEKDSEKERAVRIAKGTNGVKSVESYILPKKADDSCGTADNLAIRGKVEARLLADVGIWTPIDVKVVQCRVVLLGIMETGEEVARARTHAGSVAGNRGVVSYLKATESQSNK